MDFIHARDASSGVLAMAGKISEELRLGKRVLWLVCGGSNIPLSAQAEKLIRQKVTPQALKNLTIGQTDERFGAVGHQDSNWRQMLDAGFALEGIHALPILKNKSLEETVEEYAKALDEEMARVDMVVAQFGIGADGHVAGMLPHTKGVEASKLVFGYEAPPYVRITITPPTFARIDAAYTFAFGESKHEAVTKLWQKDLTVSEMPCQILKRIDESFFYSDQI